MKSILVCFKEQDLSYAFFCDIEVFIGDIVVVNCAGRSAVEGFATAIVSQVRGLTEQQTKSATKWVVSKVDIKSFEQKLKEEELKIEILNKLEQKREEIDKIEVYKNLAATDDEVKTLLEEYGRLTGVNLIPLETKKPKKTKK